MNTWNGLIAVMHLNINNEFSRLKSVILGHADNCGGQPHLDETYDPKTKEYLKEVPVVFEKVKGCIDEVCR